MQEIIPGCRIKVITIGKGGGGWTLTLRLLLARDELCIYPAIAVRSISTPRWLSRRFLIECAELGTVPSLGIMANLASGAEFGEYRNFG